MGRLVVWRGGLRIGLSSMLREPLLGLKRLILPVSYWRAAEFAYVMRQVPPGRQMRVLDLGSPKDLAGMLARRHGHEVVATDIRQSAIDLSERYAQAQGLAGVGAGRVLSEVADGRNLPYADDSFDHAFSVSVLEHIPAQGDQEAIRELARVVRPGGRIVITVPFDEVYRETWVDHDVYERVKVGDESVFWERHYDEEALEKRLIVTSGASLLDLSFWGEDRVAAERVLRRLNRYRVTSALAAPLEPLLSLLFLGKTREGDCRKRMAAFLTLQVTENELE